MFCLSFHVNVRTEQHPIRHIMQTPQKRLRQSDCEEANDRTFKAAKHMASVLLSPDKQDTEHLSPLALMGRLSQPSPESEDENIHESTYISEEKQQQLFRDCLEELTGQSVVEGTCGKHCCAAHLVSLSKTDLPGRSMGMTMWLCLMLLTSSSCRLSIMQLEFLIRIGVGTNVILSASIRESVAQALAPSWICKHINQMMSWQGLLWYPREDTEVVLQVQNALHRVPRKSLHSFLETADVEEIVTDPVIINRLQKFNDKSFKFLKKNADTTMFRAQALLGYSAHDAVMYEICVSKVRAGIGFYNFQAEGEVFSWPHKVTCASHVPGAIALYNPAGLQQFTSAVPDDTMPELEQPEPTSHQSVRQSCRNTIDFESLALARSNILQEQQVQNMINFATNMIHDPYRLFAALNNSVQQIKQTLVETSQMFVQAEERDTCA